MVKTARKDVKFDKRAAKYDDGFEGKISQKVYQLVMESVELNSGDKILDMECGTGTILYSVCSLSSILSTNAEC